MPHTEHGLGISSGQSKEHDAPPAKPYAQKPQRPGRQAIIPDLINNDSDANTDAPGIQPADFLGDLAHPESEASQYIAGLLHTLPPRRQSPVIAIIGNTLVAAGAAITLAVHGGEKTCLLELGYERPQEEALLKSLLHLDFSVGVSDVFKGEIGLDDLFIKARISRPHPDCYVLPQGRFKTGWTTRRERLGSLTRALARKFHRVVLCLPALDKSTAQALSDAGVGWVLANGDDTSSGPSRKAIGILQEAGCPIHII